jgi:hypothetical protein
MAFLEFTFQSFWHFAGVLMLLGLVVQALGMIVAGVKR